MPSRSMRIIRIIYEYVQFSWKTALECHNDLSGPSIVFSRAGIFRNEDKVSVDRPELSIL